MWIGGENTRAHKANRSSSKERGKKKKEGEGKKKDLGPDLGNSDGGKIKKNGDRGSRENTGHYQSGDIIKPQKTARINLRKNRDYAAGHLGNNKL